MVKHLDDMAKRYYMLKKGDEIVYTGNNHAEMMDLIPKNDRYLHPEESRYNSLDVLINPANKVVVRFGNGIHWVQDEGNTKTGYFASSGHGYFIFSSEDLDSLLVAIKHRLKNKVPYLLKSSERHIKELTEYFSE